MCGHKVMWKLLSFSEMVQDCPLIAVATGLVVEDQEVSQDGQVHNEISTQGQITGSPGDLQWNEPGFIVGWGGVEGETVGTRISLNDSPWLLGPKQWAVRNS